MMYSPVISPPNKRKSKSREVTSERRIIRMHSTCYVIVPEDDYPNNVDQYLKKVLAQYYTELERGMS